MTKYQSEKLKYFLILYKVVFYGSLFKKKELFFIQLLIAKNSTKYFLKKINFLMYLVLSTKNFFKTNRNN